MSSSSSSTRKEKHWMPLESNPDLINKFLGQLGLPPHWSVSEIYGLDEELIMMVPQPVRAVLLVYPLTEKSEAYNTSQSESLSGTDTPSSLFYVKQTVGNACGTIALLHAVMNDADLVKALEDDSFFKKFYIDSQNKTPEQRAELLEESDALESSHQSIAAEATSDVNHAANDNLHFIALVHHNGHLYELDGRKKQPVDHGTTTSSKLLYDAVNVCQQFIEREPGDIRFTMLALTDTPQD